MRVDKERFKTFFLSMLIYIRPM